MNDKHLSDEIIIGWIERNQPKPIYDHATAHLQECDQCFTQYYLLQSSLTESVEVSLEQTPVEILEYAYEQLGLKTLGKPKKNIFNKIREKINIIGKKIINYLTIPDIGWSISNALSPRLIPVGVISIGIIAVITLTIFNRTGTGPQFIPTGPEEEEGLAINYTLDTLRVTQSVKVPNNVIIMTVNGDTLYNAEFSELNNPIPVWNYINPDVFRNKTVNVIIIAQEEVVLDTSIRIF